MPNCLSPEPRRTPAREHFRSSGLPRLIKNHTFLLMAPVIDEQMFAFKDELSSNWCSHAIRPPSGLSVYVTACQSAPFSLDRCVISRH